MISLNGTTRDNKTKGQLSTIRKSGSVPAIVYGGKVDNEKISISKKLLKSTIEKENFLSNIITLSIDGKNLKNLTNNPGDDWNPRFYPDGNKIIFQSNRDGNWEIYLMERNGNGQKNLTNHPSTDYSYTIITK